MAAEGFSEGGLSMTYPVLLAPSFFGFQVALMVRRGSNLTYILLTN
jgi:hypothetical protein